MDIIVMIIIGFLAGAIARMLKPGPDNMGFIFTTLLGIAGAVVGGFIGRSLGLYEAGETAGFLVSVLGAVLLLVLVQSFSKRRMA